jgi:hypothetical protein
MIAPEHETARPPTGPSFGDAVTFAWGDLEAEVYGSARIGIVGGAKANVLGFLFAGSELVTPYVAGGEDPGAADWSRVAAGGLETEILTPLEAWRVSAEDFDLRFTAVSPPGELRSELSGLEGYEQICRVEGTVRGRPISCLGQRGHEWGTPDWERIALARNVCAWVGEDAAVVASAVRPVGARAHAEEEVVAVIFDPEPAPIGEPRLSTVYDADGRQRRAGLELWVGEEDEYPRRLAGEAVAGTSLEMGELRLDVAFFRWRMEGREGAGRYDVMRRA